jgi:methionine-rich copper-binding protein CopC
MLRRFAALALAVLAVAPQAAHAHAILLDSTPADGTTLKPGPAPLRLHFNSRIDAARSRIALRAPSGQETVLHLAPDRLGDTLTGELDLRPGAYVLHWQVLAIDGHITRGELRFTAAP